MKEQILESVCEKENRTKTCGSCGKVVSPLQAINGGDHNQRRRI